MLELEMKKMDPIISNIERRCKFKVLKKKEKITLVFFNSRHKHPKGAQAPPSTADDHCLILVCFIIL